MLAQMKEQWDSRYSREDYIYGTDANEFLKEQLAHLPKGRTLLPADGEGRNGVYAANLGWEVSCFDISEEGKKKALKLADKARVEIDYKVGLLPELPYSEGEFDAVVLIYAHFPPNIRAEYHRIISSLLRSGGTIIFEAFGKKHLAYREENPAVGGPPVAELLYSIEEIKRDFPGYDFTGLGEYEVTLNEGPGHVGTGSVIRFTATKK